MKLHLMRDAQIPDAWSKFCTVLPNILSKITAVFILTYKKVSSSHALTTNLHITVWVKGHSGTVGPQ